MKLREYLKTIPEDAEIYIGVISSYLYIGTAAHFVEVEERISSELLGELIKLRANARRNVLFICKNGVSPKKKAKKDSKGKHIPAETIEQYIKRIHGAANRLKSNYGRISMLTDSINDFKGLMLRDVLSTSEKPIYGGIKILISGIEKGKFWTREEYDEYEKTGKLPNFYEDDSDDP